MKQAAAPLPPNAFLKVIVGTHIRRLYFKDVKRYKKLVKPHIPAIPSFEPSEDWNKSTITNCDYDFPHENIIEQTSYNI
jgi:hypothetical protein